MKFLPCANLRQRYCRNIGENLSLSGELRIFLTGRITVIGPGGQFDERDLPGNMARVVLAILVHTRGPVSRARVADTLWPDELPRSADASINSMISHTRSLFSRAGFDGKSLLTSTAGSYMVNLPANI